MRRESGGAFRGWFILAALAFAQLHAACPASASAGRATLQEILNAPVKNFESNKSLVPTLIEISSIYHVPMGIEMVTPAAVHSPVVVELRDGSVAELLDRCTRSLPGYRWAVEDGVVDVYGPSERAWELNLLNFVVPRIKIHEGTLNRVNAVLRMSIPARLPARYSSIPPGKVFSTVGDSPGVGSLEGHPLDFEARGQTVRTILNRIVALSKGKVIWVARVPPAGLSSSPNAGLWLLAPPVASAIVPHLEPSLLSKEK